MTVVYVDCRYHSFLWWFSNTVHEKTTVKMLIYDWFAGRPNHFLNPWTKSHLNSLTRYLRYHALSEILVHRYLRQLRLQLTCIFVRSSNTVLSLFWHDLKWFYHALNSLVWEEVSFLQSKRLQPIAQQSGISMHKRLKKGPYYQYRPSKWPLWSRLFELCFQG